MSKRTADLIVISSHAKASPAAHCAPQLACVNRKIVAGKAIEAATELQRMPGMSAEAFAETLDFWRRVRDHAGPAALDSLGGNSTLAEALVTFRLLHQPGDE